MIKRIEDIYDFQGWINDLHSLHMSLDHFATSMSPTDFVKMLISEFLPLNYIFGDRYDDGRIRYFAYIVRSKDNLDNGHFWLFYVHKDMDSSDLIEGMKYYVKDDLRFITIKTTNTGRGYKRWISKFGAYPSAVFYSMKLGDS